MGTLTISAGMTSLIWLILLFVLVVIEIITMGLTTIWFAGGALVATILSMLSVPISIQIVAFLLVSFVLLIFTRPVAMQYFNRARIRTNTESLVGQQAIVVSEIDNLQQIGRVTIQGKEWTARTMENGMTVPVGAVVVVCAIDGVKLIVKEKREE